MRPMTPRKRLPELVAVIFAVAGLGVTAVSGIAWAEEPEAPVLIERSFQELELRRSLPPEIVLSAPEEDLGAWVTMKESLPTFGIEIDTAGILGDRFYLRLKTVEMASRTKSIYDAIRPSKATISLSFQLLLGVEKETGNSGDSKSRDNPPLHPALRRPPFNFQDYQVLSVASITINSGERVEDLGLTGVKGRGWEIFQLDAMPSYDPGSDMIRLEHLEIELVSQIVVKLPPDRQDMSRIQLLGTTLNVKNGDTIIVGGSSIEGRSYVLVVSAKTVWKEGTGGPAVIPAPDTMRFDGRP